MKNIITIIRLTYLASSVFSLAAAQKSSKNSGTAPPDASKAGKSTLAPTYPSMSYSMSMSTPSPKSGKGNTPGTKSAKTPGPISTKSSKTGGDYFIAPFSCPQFCISAAGYELSSHLLDDAVSECDASDDYQMWKVHQSGTFLKFESAAQYDEGMCLAVVHQDPDHPSNAPGRAYPDWSTNGGNRRLFVDWFGAYGFNPGSTLGISAADDVDEMCTGQLGLADCNHPGSYWYNTGGQYLSALCWSEGVSAAMTTDCTDLGVADSSTSDLTTSETFMLLESD